MRRSRFTEEQIVALLKQAEAGAKVRDLCRRHGISDATFYKWRSKHDGRGLPERRRMKQLDGKNRPLTQLKENSGHMKGLKKEERRLRQLEEENLRLRALVADLTLSNQTLRLMAAKKW